MFFLRKIFFLFLIQLSCSKASNIDKKSEQISAKKINRETIILELSTELPNCTTASKGEIFYITDEQIFKYCNGSKYEIANLNGDSGSTGAQGARGSKGELGPLGPSGPKGPTGPKGNTGDAGLTGFIGHRGGVGFDGFQGPTGPIGPGASGFLKTSSYSTTDECYYLGIITRSGIDDNANSQLDLDEVNETIYKCYNLLTPVKTSNLTLSGTGSSIIKAPIVFNNSLYFFANNKTYVNNGGTVQEFQHSSISIHGVTSLVVNDKLFILDNDSTLHSISTTANYDGNYDESYDGNFSNFAAELTTNNIIYYDNYYYFGANNNLIQMSSDGTFISIANINTSGNDEISNMTLLGTKLIFSSFDSSSNKKLWTFDLSSLSTSPAEITADNLDSNSNPQFFQTNGLYLYFMAKNTDGYSTIWKTDGTITYNLYEPISQATQANTLYKEGDFLIWPIGILDSSSNLPIYSLYIPSENFTLLTNLTSSGILSQKHLKQLNSDLYLIANSTIDGVEVYKISSTLSLSVMSVNSTGSSNPSNLVVYKNNLYFSATDGTTGIEIWKTDGTTTTLAFDINPSGDSNPSNFLEYMGNLFFSASNGSSGAELWKIDIASSSAILLDFYSGSQSSNPSQFINYNGLLYFSASIAESTYDLYFMSLLGTGIWVE